MNTKKRTLYLLIAVVLIYMAIIVRFFLLSDGGTEEDITLDPITEFKPIRYEVDKDFTIKNAYRDPFLGTLSRGKTTVKTTQKDPDPVTDDPFPNVNYIGLISDAGSGKKVFSVRISGKEYVVQSGATVDGLTIISGTPKQVVVSYQGTRKTIKISGG